MKKKAAEAVRSAASAAVAERSVKRARLGEERKASTAGITPPPYLPTIMIDVRLFLPRTTTGDTTVTEENDFARRPEYLYGTIEALQQTIRVMLAAMQPDQRKFVLGGLAEYASKTRELADARQTDPLMDHAEAAWDVSQSLENAMEDWAESFDRRFRS